MLALDTSSKLASALLQYQLDKLPIDYIEKRNAIVDAVTLDDTEKDREKIVGPGFAHRDRRSRPAGAAQPAGGDAAHGEELSRFAPEDKRSTNPLSCFSRFIGNVGPPVTPCCGFPATFRSTRTTSRSLRPRLRPGRAERQQALDRRATALRHRRITLPEMPRCG
jgi:hypothetical protein